MKGYAYIIIMVLLTFVAFSFALVLMGHLFTRKYKCHKLVYFEVFQNPQDAIDREKQLKWWHREWKRNLIDTKNPGWEDLGAQLKANPII